MPSFGKKGGNSIEETMAGLEAPLLRFHEACEGNLEEVAILMHTMSGQMLPPPALFAIFGVTPEQIKDSSRANPVKLSTAQVSFESDDDEFLLHLLGGVAGALDENDSAAMYVDKIAKCTAGISERAEIEKLRAAISFNESQVLDIESRLLKNMQGDTEMLGHLGGIKELHDKWRENADVSDPTRYPTIVVGPQILSFEPMSAAHHGQVLNPSEREQFFLRPGEDVVDMLREKLAPARNTSAAVVEAQCKRVAWLATQATGVNVNSEALRNAEWVAVLDSKLAAEVNSDAFQKTIDGILGDVKLGPSSVRIDAVETEIVKAMGHAGAAMPAPITGYEIVVFHACLRAITEENGDSEGSPIAASLSAVKSTRRKIGDRFFRKKWLPLETDPEAFNKLGQSLGLPTKTVEFYEVLGMDPELLDMVPSPSYAVVVCFPPTPEYCKAAGESEGAAGANGPYFLRQTVPDACGTVALVHAFANLPESKQEATEPGADWLQKFVAKTKSADAFERAAALETDEDLSMAHNSMAQLVEILKSRAIIDSVLSLEANS